MTYLQEFISQISIGIHFTGDIGRDVPRFLTHHDCPVTAMHSADVAAEAKRLAEIVGVDPRLAEAAGWLHDVSAVLPIPERVIIAERLGLEVLPEEIALPMIIHQKLSVVLTKAVFGVENKTVLSAVGCHTTLRANATIMDKVVFIADKIRWDHHGRPPYYDELLTALGRSLDEAVLFYLTYVWERRHTLQVLHPWLREARDYMLITSIDSKQVHASCIAHQSISY